MKSLSPIRMRSRDANVPLVISLNTVHPPDPETPRAQPRNHLGAPRLDANIRRKRVITLAAGALCLVGLGIALVDGGGTSTIQAPSEPLTQPPTQAPTHASSDANSQSPLAASAIDELQTTSDPLKAVLQMRSNGELGSDVSLWRDATASVLSRNGDIILVQITETNTGDERDVVLVRSGDEWALRHVSSSPEG